MITIQRLLDGDRFEITVYNKEDKRTINITYQEALDIVKGMEDNFKKNPCKIFSPKYGR